MLIKKLITHYSLYIYILLFFQYPKDKLNEKYKFIPYTEFYNDAVNEQLEIKEDYPCWKAKEYVICLIG